MMKPGQVVFVALVGGCAVLMVGAGMLLGGIGMDVEALAPMDRAGPGDAQDPAEVVSFQLPPFDQYAIVVDRPLFNDDRLPKPTEVVDGPPLVEGPEITEVALNITVNGIIITPDLKVALVTDNETREKLRIREKMPLEGDQGAWVLQRIEPRKLVFEGGGDGPVEVELATYTKALKGGKASPARKPVAKSASPNTSGQNKQPAQQSAQAALVQERLRRSGNDTAENQEDRAAKAEEIRRRVAERRAQLREEAARRRAETEDGN